VRILATYSIKGGVGKTSAAVNLGALAALEGRRTLIWDLDPQGAASFLLRVKPKVKGGGRKLVRGRRDPLSVMKGTDFEGLDLLPADLSYRHLDLVLDQSKRPQRGLGRVLRSLTDEYDVAILDCAPSISLVSESVFDAADLLLVPLVPSTLSVRTLDQLRKFLGRQERPSPAVLPFFSMVDRRKRLHRELVESVQGVGRAIVPSASIIEQMGPRREPVVVSHPSSPAALAYTALWAEVRGVLNGAPGVEPDGDRLAAGREDGSPHRLA
jgi:chromosome partitioning protein